MKFGSLLIATYGRSGSTLLQGILNTIPGVLMRGENNNFVFDIFQSYRKLAAAKQEPYSQTAQDAAHPWYGILDIDLDEFKSMCRELLFKMLVPAPLRSDIRCYGFKEIRYPFVLKHLEEYLNFLRDIMPQLAIIFNFREHQSLLQSAWWRDQDPSDVLQLVSQFEEAAQRFHHANSDSTFIVRYEEVMQHPPSRLQHLFEFLGAEYDYNKVRNVMDVTHSTRT
jgi:hypothetical protein